jgi:hypothetical protein
MDEEFADKEFLFYKAMMVGDTNKSLKFITWNKEHH